MTKYNNTKVEYDGIKFDSKKEARRYAELKMLEQRGEILDLRTQHKFVLIPSQRSEITGKVIERELAYIADFVYTVAKTGEIIVEDVKGYRDPSSAGYAKFVIKRKLMLWKYGIMILEV